MIRELLEYSYENKLSHIPSALSMIDYVNVLFSEKIIVPYRDKIVIGKPFGSQAYYLIWKKLNYLKDIEKLSVGVKHDEIDFIDYGEETMGNALGVGSGISLTTNKKVWVNITDATLQMGNTLEALQFIGQNNLKNIFVTVDFNGSQVTGKTNDIISVEPCINLCDEYNWKVQEVDGHNINELKNVFTNSSNFLPNIIFCRTKKGKGIQTIEKDVKKWHYKKIETLKELELLEQELQGI